MKFLGVIPARYGSSRFEGKPLEFIDLYDLEDFVYESGKTEKNRDIVEDFKNVIKRSRKK